MALCRECMPQIMSSPWNVRQTPLRCELEGAWGAHLVGSHGLRGQRRRWVTLRCRRGPSRRHAALRFLHARKAEHEIVTVAWSPHKTSTLCFRLVSCDTVLKILQAAHQAGASLAFIFGLWYCVTGHSARLPGPGYQDGAMAVLCIPAWPSEYCPGQPAPMNCVEMQN